jgi:hypothetical protein
LTLVFNGDSCKGFFFLKPTNEPDDAFPSLAGGCVFRCRGMDQPWGLEPSSPASMFLEGQSIIMIK